MKPISAIVVAFSTILASACAENFEEYSYKIVEDGGPETTDRQVYSSLGDQTFSKIQKYKITLSNGKKEFHYLVANTTMKIGSKIIDREYGVSIPIIDGSYSYECSHFYSIKLSASIDDTDAPVCDINPIGVVIPSASASRVQNAS